MLGRRAELEEKSCPATRELYEKIGYFSRRNWADFCPYVIRNTVFAGRDAKRDRQPACAKKMVSCDRLLYPLQSQRRPRSRRALLRPHAMSDKTKDIDAIAKALGFREVRRGKHRIFKNSDGRMVPMSATPSDWRASRNQERDFRRAAKPAIPISESVDAEFPKREKKRAGQARPAGVFNPYSGLPRQSVSPTEQETIKTLQGFLRSRDAYRFQSELKKEIVSRLNNSAKMLCDLNDECLRHLKAMRAFVTAGVPPEQIPAGKRREYEHFLDAIACAVDELRDARVPLRASEVWAKTQLILEDQSALYRREPPFKNKFISLCGRAAKRLLRGSSAADLRAFVEPEVQSIGFDFDLCGLIEEIATEKSDLLPDQK
jgi:hypothetical protein